jgi:hypothetical protein
VGGGEEEADPKHQATQTATGSNTLGTGKNLC